MGIEDSVPWLPPMATSMLVVAVIDRWLLGGGPDTLPPWEA